jgi:hypothetical protein
MSLALTTTHENTAIFRGVVMSLGTPRRMKMTLIAAPPQSRSRDSLQRAGSEIVCYLVLHACRGVGLRYPHQGFSTESPMSLALTTTHENCYFQRSCHVRWDTTTHENDFSLPCHQAAG